MRKINSLKIAEILEYESDVVDVDILDVSTDSRQVGKNTLFIALRGERFDGHDFIKEVLDKGAPLVVSEKKIKGVDAKRVIVVADTLLAFGKIAQYNRRRYKGIVIGLTGSCGKTTTKEELKAALQEYAPTYATTGNFNNFIGVPRSLLDIDMKSKYAVIEMRMSNLGEIRYLSKFVEPDIALVTNVYPMHLEYLKTLENIAHAKSEIFESVKKGGIGIFNEDTSHAEILRRAVLDHGLKMVAFGRKNHAKVNLKLKEKGEHFLYNAWAVLSVIEALQLPLEPAVEVLNNFTALEGRGKQYPLNIDGKKITLIDNSYSGGPDATILAVEALGKMKTKGRKIAVIGKMAELGDYTREAHIRVGQALRKNNIDMVIGVCQETEDVLAQLSSETEQHYFPDINGVSAFLMQNLRDGDVVLVKGSHYSSQVYKAAADLKTKGR